MAKKIKIQGVSLQLAPGEASGSVDYTFPAEKEFHGVMIAVEDAIYGDEIDLKLIVPVGHPANPGSEEVVAHDYSSNAKLIAGNQKIDINVLYRDDPADIPQGLILRFTFTAIDANGRKVQAWYRFKE